MNRNLYKTKQKEYVLNFFKNNPGTLYKAKDVYNELNKKHQAIGITTIYRTLESLVENNSLSVSNKETGKEYIFLPCSNSTHFHLVCESCGSILHIDCDSLNVLVSHLSIDHNFCLNTNSIILKGVCKKCI